MKDDDLDALFSAARSEVPDPRPAFLARLAEDAATAVTQTPTAAPVPVPGVLAQIRTLLGGWSGMGGLVAAAATGFWIGVAPPDLVPDPALLVTGSSADVAFGGFLTLSELDLQSLEDG